MSCRFDRLKFFGFLMISILTLLVYFPSFYHMPRADHVFYLADMADKHDWVSLAIKSYDFSRSRSFAAGDGTLFRPGACFLMGTEKSLFGYNFMWWQITGVVLHLWVVWLLLGLLLTVQRSQWAVWLAGFFSLLYFNHEVVIWHHINSMLVAVAGVLLSTRQVYQYSAMGERQPWRMVVAFVSMLVACFTYEAMNVFALILAGYLFFEEFMNGRKKWPAIMMASAAGLYLAISTGHYYFLRDEMVEYGRLGGRSDFWTSVYYFIVANIWWLYSGFFPTLYTVTYTQGRAVLSQPEELIKALNFSDPSVWLGVVFALMLVGLIVRTMSRDLLKKRLVFLTMIAVLIGSWAAMVVLYRVGNRGFYFALGESLHYNYVFWSFLMIFLYAAIDWPKLSLLGGKKFGGVFIGVLVALGVVNGALIYRTNQRLAVRQNETRFLVKTIESMINEMRDQPGFSFYVHPRFPGNIPIPNQLRAEDPFFKRYNYIELIYLNYFDREKPSFIFLPADKGRQARILPTQQAISTGVDLFGLP